MIEQIGNVKLNLTYYTGEDQYSDGEIENELLEIVQNYNTFDEIIKNDTRWPILYHLSKYREHIIEWYPFDNNYRALEIGAGCGAITGAISRKVNSVTCVELSKRRSLINAYRHQNSKNIEIFVGNFNEMEFEYQFDYITLIGVLEYAPSFSNSDKPFQDFLKYVKSLLKPNGKLFIAIENRYGLKYWAGAREDHTGKFFDSIEGYRESNKVRTFSKYELQVLLEECGIRNIDFYYPFPDYKLPFQIFSDKRKPKIGELRDLIHNYDNNRFTLFNEDVVYDSLNMNDNFSFFSNSFLVVASID
ncbi:class I SAM-dependent methyltransferase [Lysinibacillus louembei]|uniref:Class I SAM-dependent methyltransferase n=1 Tax=Lysinibacillus louembei TaxID=1470088 RepID=A0ABZ0RYZ9_9BACI|nr:class I SAM-dependent methyltransferase [Lysinibacillus louembei]WPK12481.1 class I SAM-dependent methyltransferase [Lysinibacillus louembei]